MWTSKYLYLLRFIAFIYSEKQSSKRRQFAINLHSSASQKTWIFRKTDVKTSILTE